MRNWELGQFLGYLGPSIKKSHVSSFLSLLGPAKDDGGWSHVNQELDGLIDVVEASAQSTHGLILREAHAHDRVDVRLRGPHIGVYTRAVEGRALRRLRYCLRGGGDVRRHGGLRRIGGGGNREVISRGSLCRWRWCVEGARGCAGAWRGGGRRGSDLSMEVIRTRLGGLL